MYIYILTLYSVCSWTLLTYISMYNIHIRNYKDICCYMNLCANNHYLFLPLAILLFSSIVIFIVGIIIIAILYTHLYIYIVHIGYYLYIYIYTYIPQTKTSTCFTDVPFFRDPLQALARRREHPHLPAQFSFYLTGRGSNDAKSLGDAGGWEGWVGWRSYMGIGIIYIYECI